MKNYAKTFEDSWKAKRGGIVRGVSTACLCHAFSFSLIKRHLQGIVMADCLQSEKFDLIFPKLGSREAGLIDKWRYDLSQGQLCSPEAAHHELRRFDSTPLKTMIEKWAKSDVRKKLCVKTARRKRKKSANKKTRKNSWKNRENCAENL